MFPKFGELKANLIGRVKGALQETVSETVQAVEPDVKQVLKNSSDDILENFFESVLGVALVGVALWQGVKPAMQEDPVVKDPRDIYTPYYEVHNTFNFYGKEEDEDDKNDG